MIRPAGFWIGHPGALFPLPDAKGSLVRNMDRAATFTVSAGGQRRAYIAARRAPLREWAVSIPNMSPTESTILHSLIMNTDPPYVWVDPWSMVTNLLTPTAARLQGTTPALVPLGRQPLAEGGWAVTAASNPTGVVVDIPPAPVVATEPVTVSAYLTTPTSATVSARFINSDGAPIGTVAVSAPVTGMFQLKRTSVTIPVAPIGAAGVSIRVTGASVIAYPAVTWSKELLPYGPAGGAGEVVVTGLAESIEWAMREAVGQRLSDVSFTVQEVG